MTFNEKGLRILTAMLRFNKVIVPDEYYIDARFIESIASNNSMCVDLCIRVSSGVVELSYEFEINKLEYNCTIYITPNSFSVELYKDSGCRNDEQCITFECDNCKYSTSEQMYIRLIDDVVTMYDSNCINMQLDEFFKIAYEKFDIIKSILDVIKTELGDSIVL